MEHHKEEFKVSKWLKIVIPIFALVNIIQIFPLVFSFSEAISNHSNPMHSSPRYFHLWYGVSIFLIITVEYLNLMRRYLFLRIQYS